MVEEYCEEHGIWHYMLEGCPLCNLRDAANKNAEASRVTARARAGPEREKSEG
jgi:hypothetical protein